MAQVLTDTELLAKYELADPGYDALYFVRLVDQLARKRRCHLKATISFEGGEGVYLSYKIYGFDSAGKEVLTQTSAAYTALASCVRILNKRFADLMNARR